MVDMVATNAKLRGRVIRILCEASGADEAEVRAALEMADGELKPALLSLLAGVAAEAARTALEQHGGSVAQALRCLQAPHDHSRDPDHQDPYPHDPDPHHPHPHGTAPHEQETAR